MIAHLTGHRLVSGIRFLTRNEAVAIGIEPGEHFPRVIDGLIPRFRFHGHSMDEGLHLGRWSRGRGGGLRLRESGHGGTDCGGRDAAKDQLFHWMSP
jgi:hypothetical protein